MPDPQTRPATWQDIISHEAESRGIDPRLALAMADTESSFNPAARSPKGAMGLFQLMPETAKRLGVDPADPVQNIRGGLTEMKRLLDEHGGDVTMALRRYNGSPQAPDEATDPYVQSVLGRLTGQPGARPSRGRPQVNQPPGTVIGVKQPPEEAAGGPHPPPSPPEDASSRVATPPSSSFWGRTWEGAREGALSALPGGRATGRLLEGATDVVRHPVRNLPIIGGAIGGVAGLAGGPAGAIGGATLGAAGGEAWRQNIETGKSLVTGRPPEQPHGLVADLAPPTTTSRGAALSIGREALTSGLIPELGGQVFAWVPKAVGRRLVASAVGRNAKEGMYTAAKESVAPLVEKFEQATTASSHLPGTTQAAVTPMSRAKVGGEMTQAATGAFNDIVAKPPSASLAGSKAAAVMQGPAKVAKDQAGLAVRQAAEAMPAVDIAPVKTALEHMGEDITPSTRAAAQDPLAQLAVTGGARGRIAQSLEEARVAWQKKLASLGVPLPPEHPLPGLLGEIQNLPDTISGADAHKFKRLLDDQISSWEGPARKQIDQITKGARTALRGAMHDPAYDAATAEFERIAPIYTKEYIAKFSKVARTDPDALVRMIDPKKPEAFRLMRELFLTQAAEGGGATQGRQAFDAVTAAWTHKNLLKGGIATLDMNLRQLQPEFGDLLFHSTPGGRVVGQNLRLIASAWKSGSERFLASSISGKTALPTPEQLGADVVRVGGLGIFQIWGGLSLMRLAKGPRAADLIEWMAYSPENTQLWVKLFTGNSPSALAVADVARLTQVLNRFGVKTPAQPSRQSQVGTPPPR